VQDGGGNRSADGRFESGIMGGNVSARRSAHTKGMQAAPKFGQRALCSQGVKPFIAHTLAYQDQRISLRQGILLCLTSFPVRAFMGAWAVKIALDASRNAIRDAGQFWMEKKSLCEWCL